MSLGTRQEKVSGHVVLALNESLQSILVASSELKGKMHYALMRNLKFLEPHLKSIEASKKQIIESFSDKDENGQPKILESGELSYSAENKQSATEEFNAVLNSEYEVTIYVINLEWYSEVVLDSTKLRFDGLFLETYIQE
jgi:hypothetical protein